MLRVDLEEAGIDYKDESGMIVDSHALRTTFITNLSRAGVSPKMAQTLARHSDINLTMNTYTTLGVYDQSAAVESLPPVPAKSRERRAKQKQSRGLDAKQQKSAPKMVPILVPRGAENGAIHLAAETYQSASDCSEEVSEEPDRRPKEKAASSDEFAAYGATLPVVAPVCRENARGGTRTPTPEGHWILNPARLPIPPLSLA